MHRFEVGNHYGGRKPGSRNRFHKHAYATILAHVKHREGIDTPPAEFVNTNLWKALDITLRERPNEYAKNIILMLPKEVQLGQALDNWDADEIEDIIPQLERRALEARTAEIVILLPG